MKASNRKFLLPLITIIILGLFFNLLYITDNKYNVPPPTDEAVSCCYKKMISVKKDPLF